MKVKCNRIVSVVLAFLLACSCFFSTFGFVSATQENTQENTQLIESIKTAWQKLKHKPEALLDVFWHEYKDAEGKTIRDPYEGTEMEIAGEKVNTYDFDASSANTYVSGKTNYNNSDSTINVDDYESIYLYIKPQDTTKNAFSVISSQKTKIVTVKYDPSDVENWMKLELSPSIENSSNKPYFNGGANADNVVSYLGRIQFKDKDILSSVVMGVKKLDFEKEFKFNLNDDTNDWSLINWIEKASEFDFTKFDNSEELINILASDEIAEILANKINYVADELRKEWKELKYKPEVLLDTFWHEYKDAAGKTVRDPYEGTEMEIAGEKVNTYDFDASSANTYVSGKTNYNNSDSTINVDDYESIYLYIKPQDTTKNAFSVISSIKTKIVTVKYDPSDVENWMKLELSPSIENSSNKPYFNGGANADNVVSYLGRIQFKDKDILSSVVMGVRKFVIPEGFDNWGVTQLLEEANSLDLTKYEDSKAFENAKNELRTLVYSDPSFVINSLKKEWSNLTEKQPTVILPTIWDYATGSYVQAQNLPKEEFDNGSSLEVFNFKGTSDITQKITLCEDPKNNSGPKIDCNEYSEIYLYYKSNTNINGSIYNGSSLALSALLFEKNDNYTKLDIKKLLSDNNIAEFNRLHTSFKANGVELSVSQMVGIKKAMLPLGTDSWNLADWAIAAGKLDLNLYSNTENFVSILEFAKKYVEENNIVSTVKFTVSTNNFSDADVAGFGNNILAEEKYVAKIKVDGNVVENDSNYPLNRLYDGKVDGDTNSSWMYNKKKFTQRDDGYVDISFDLGSTYKINKFFINHIEGLIVDTYGLATGRYEIYASEDLFNLCYDENRVVYYDNMSDSSNGTTIGQLFTAFADGVVARYVCVRVLTPYNDEIKASEYASKQTSNPRYVRIKEFGIYGEPYTALLSETNLLEHTPLNVYRTDSAGNKTEVPETEFGYQQYLQLCDGKLDASADILRNNSTIDFVTNLLDSQKINALGISTTTESIKHLKIYASPVLEGVWDENNLVFEYKVSETSPKTNQIVKRFEEAKEMKYVRFSILDAEETIDITEMYILGISEQNVKHHNIIGGNVGSVTTYVQDKSTYLTSYVRHDINRGSCHSQTLLKHASITDMDLDTVYDFMIGEKGKKSLNFLIDLNGISAIDTILFKSGGSERYFPTNMNFYVGTDEKEIFAKDAKPLKTYSSAEESGIYEYNFLPKSACYVRIEVIDNSCDYYYENLVTVVSEIMVNGIKTSVTDEDVVASFKDEKTGIKLDILSKFTGDAFEKVTGIKVTERTPTADEIEQGTAYGLNFNGKIYTVQLLDYSGKIVTDVEGREVRVTLPVPKDLDMNTAYVGSIVDGEVAILEHTVEKVDDAWCMIVVFEEVTNLVVAPISFNEYRDTIIEYPSDDTYVEDLTNDFYIEDSDTEDTEIETSDDETVTTGRKKYYKKIKKGTSGIETWVIVVIIVVSVILVAGIVLLIIFRKKIFRRKN